MPTLITIKEAAERLSTSPWTVSRMIDRGELPAYGFPSGSIRIDQDDIDAFLVKCRITTPQQSQGAAT